MLQIDVMIMAILVSVILLFAGIGVLILIHFCIVGRAFRRGFGGNSGNAGAGAAESGGLRSASSMSRDDVEKLPCFDFQSREQGECAVCLENLKAGDKCRLLPQCRHCFHAECVDLWLLKTPFCPICRTSAEFAENHSPEIDVVAENSESTAAQPVEIATPLNSTQLVLD